MAEVSGSLDPAAGDPEAAIERDGAPAAAGLQLVGIAHCDRCDQRIESTALDLSAGTAHCHACGATDARLTEAPLRRLRRDRQGAKP